MTFLMHDIKQLQWIQRSHFCGDEQGGMGLKLRVSIALFTLVARGAWSSLGMVSIEQLCPLAGTKNHAMPLRPTEPSIAEKPNATLG